jgi:DNA-binding XRE family transcriptional regulator
MKTLHEARIHKALTQTQLAELTGILQPNIAVIESGKQAAQMKTRVKLESVLGEIDWAATLNKIKLQKKNNIKAHKVIAALVGMELEAKNEFKQLVNHY